MKKKKTLNPSAQDLKIQWEIQFLTLLLLIKMLQKKFTIEIWTFSFQTAFKINFGLQEVVKLKIRKYVYGSKGPGWI